MGVNAVGMSIWSVVAVIVPNEALTGSVIVSANYWRLMSQ
jgi:hypothetical protein